MSRNAGLHRSRTVKVPSAKICGRPRTSARLCLGEGAVASCCPIVLMIVVGSWPQNSTDEVQTPLFASYSIKARRFWRHLGTQAFFARQQPPFPSAFSRARLKVESLHEARACRAWSPGQDFQCKCFPADNQGGTSLTLCLLGPQKQQDNRNGDPGVHMKQQAARMRGRVFIHALIRMRLA